MTSQRLGEGFHPRNVAVIFRGTFRHDEEETTEKKLQFFIGLNGEEYSGLYLCIFISNKT